MSNLTVKQCEQAHIPEGKLQLKLHDGNGLFLFLRVDRKTWRFKYKLQGKERLYTIGPPSSAVASISGQAGLNTTDVFGQMEGYLSAMESWAEKVADAAKGRKGIEVEGHRVQ